MYVYKMTSEIKWKSLRSLKITDAYYDELYNYVKSDVTPDRFSTSQTAWRFRKTAKLFSLDSEDNLVLVLNEPPPWAVDKKGNLLFSVRLPVVLRVVKESEKEDIMSQFFGDVKTNAYRSVDSYYTKISQEFIGITREDVKTFVNSQEVHQIQAVAEQKIVHPLITTKPMEHWEMDLVDMSEFESQNKHIHFLLVIIDIFSKFMWVRPLKNKTAPLVASELQNVFFLSGSPSIISSDNGSEFISLEMRALCERFGIELRHSLPYKPTTQGAVERSNQTLKNMIFSYMTEHHSKEYLQALQFMVHSYNTQKHSTTKFTPFQVQLKRDQKVHMLDQLVAESIQKNADKMVRRSIQKYKANTDPLVEGDHVRVAREALKQFRKLSSAFKKSKVNWTEEIYTVAEIKLEPDSKEEQYRLEDEKGEDLMEGDTVRWFYRYQLQKIDINQVQRTKTPKDKEVLNFGAKQTPESHLIELDKKAQDASELDQKHIDRVEEKKEKKEIEKIKKSADPVIRVSKRSARGVPGSRYSGYGE